MENSFSFSKIISKFRKTEREEIFCQKRENKNILRKKTILNFLKKLNPSFLNPKYFNKSGFCSHPSSNSSADIWEIYLCEILNLNIPNRQGF